MRRYGAFHASASLIATVSWLAALSFIAAIIADTFRR
jgi:hypothetical protein